MNVFSIKDVENLSGIQAHTLRIWEQRYSFIKPQRTQTNIRHYSEEELRTILNVALLNRFGFRISKIDKMSMEEIQTKIEELTMPEAHHHKVIKQMLDQMMTLQLEAFEDLLNTNLQELGLKEGMMSVVLPFLEKIGSLWAVGQINPALEHFVANIVRQKIIAYTDALPDKAENGKVVLLFLPVGEISELGILFAQYLLKSEGYRPFYLGPNVPLEDVLVVAKQVEAQVVLCHSTNVQSEFEMMTFSKKLSEILPETEMKFAGVGFGSFDKELPDNVELLYSYDEIVRFCQHSQAVV